MQAELVCLFLELQINADKIYLIVEKIVFYFTRGRQLLSFMLDFWLSKEQTSWVEYSK